MPRRCNHGVVAEELVRALADVVGPRHVLTDADERAGYEVDWTRRYVGTALAVVRPGSTAEVSRVLSLCNDRSVAVVPQGGNTGLVGGGVPQPDRPSVVLSVARLTECTVDARQGEAVVGGGVILESLQEAARATGWDLAVDLAARGSCTIGGMVATNAGGEHVVRYGAMVQQLIGIEAVLADGTVVGRVPALRKDNTGYHWAGILTGSEGTLGVVTRAHLRLVPVLPARVVALLGVPDLEAALAVTGELRRALPELNAVEVCFADGIDLVRSVTGLPAPLAQRAPVYLLVETAGDDLDLLVARLGAAVDAAGGVLDSAIASAEAERARLWQYREAHTEAISTLGVPHKLDVSIPFDRMLEFERRAREVVSTGGARLVLFGHLGDGNLHVNVLGPSADDARIDDAVLDLAASLGGSISAEHGIGVAKRAAFARTRSAAELDAMHAIKRALDPRGILNPGVLFT
jgi:FAD/FMN-containing dehydrogenase